MRVLGHSGEVQAIVEIDVEPGITVTELLVRLGSGGEELLWLEEGEDSLDPTKTLIEVGIVEFAHVHHGRCRMVAVTVRFGGEPKEHEFSPSTTVGRVFEWSVGDKGFDLPAAQRPKHTLGLCGTQEEAERKAHLGSLATDCRVCFDLAPKTRYQG